MTLASRASIRELLQSLRRGFSLQLGRRAPLLLGCDAALIVSGLVGALLRGGDPQLVYVAVVQIPVVVLGAAALSDILEIERRAGSLDLALALPASQRYFVSRVAAVCLPLALQSAAVLLLLWSVEDAVFPILLAIGAAFVLTALTGAAAMFWALRVHSPGAVWLATVATVVVLGRWSLANPIPDRLAVTGAFVGRFEEVGDFIVNTLTVALILMVLVLAARRRLARPESLVS